MLPRLSGTTPSRCTNISPFPERFEIYSESQNIAHEKPQAV